MRALLQNDWTSFVVAFIAAVLTAIFRFTHLNEALIFFIQCHFFGCFGIGGRARY